MLDASKALGHRYALQIVTSLLQDVHSRFLTSDLVDQQLSETVKKGLEAFWVQIRQPACLAKLVKAILVSHSNKLKDGMKQLVSDVVNNASKASIIPKEPQTASTKEAKEVLTIVAKEAVDAFANLSKEVKRLRVHTEESVGPYYITI